MLAIAVGFFWFPGDSFITASRDRTMKAQTAPVVAKNHQVSYHVRIQGYMNDTYHMT